jgi:hypothetical protein
VAKSGQHRRRRWGSGLQLEGGREIVQIRRRGGHLAGGSQSIERIAVGQWTEQSHRPTAIGDLHRLPLCDETKELARTLTELAHTDSSHVLLIAHCCLPPSSRTRKDRAPRADGETGPATPGTKNRLPWPPTTLRSIGVDLLVDGAERANSLGAVVSA